MKTKTPMYNNRFVQVENIKTAQLMGFTHHFSFPRTYRVIQEAPRGEAFAVRRNDGLQVICSVGVEVDAKVWIHVSFSRPDRIPDYQDIADVKKDFIGEDRKAIQVFPQKSEHVNYHPYCLHLWCCLDGDGLPDFTRGNSMI